MKLTCLSSFSSSSSSSSSSSVRIVWSRQWCEMTPCLDDEGCDLLVNQSGWTCTQPGGRVKTTTVRTELNQIEPECVTVM